MKPIKAQFRKYAGSYDTNNVFMHDHNMQGGNSSSDVRIKLALHGMGYDDTLIGSDKYNESFYGRMGDDSFWGKGEQKAEMVGYV